MIFHDDQELICKKYNSVVVPSDPDLKIGLATQTLSLQPIYGMRYKNWKGTTGWYIWGGEYSKSPDFFQPIKASDIEKLCPQVIPFLSLAPGYGFIIDSEDYEDVWFDGSILVAEQLESTP